MKRLDNKLHGGKTIRSYRDRLYNNPYYKLITSLECNGNQDSGELFNQKLDRYGWKSALWHGYHQESIYTFMRNAAWRLTPQYTFYNALEVDMGTSWYGEVKFQIWYEINVLDQRYTVEIRPHFQMPRWKVNIPLHIRMTEDSILAFAVAELNKVIFPPGAYRDCQILNKCTAEVIKNHCRAQSLHRNVAEEQENNQGNPDKYDKYILRRLQKKHNIYADYLDTTAQLLRILKQHQGYKFKDRTGTVHQRDIFQYVMDNFDGCPTELEDYIHEEFGNSILI